MDEGQVPENMRDGIHIVQPRTFEERLRVVETCAVRSSVEMPILVDTIDNEVKSEYEAQPDRLVIVGADGNIAYASEMGWEGFDASNLEGTLESVLRRVGKASSSPPNYSLTQAGGDQAQVDAAATDKGAGQPIGG